MLEGWITYKLEEIVSKLGDGLHGTPKYSENGEYAFINGNNLTNGKINIKEDTKRVNHEQYLKYKKELNNRTLLVSINGTIGNVAYYNGEKVMLGKSACYFNLNEDVDKGFVRHLISSNHFKNYLETNATGSVIKNVSLKSMREFPVKLPPLQEQRAIASILSALDDKIELNLQMNKTLEDIALALYKHWFVDFGPFQNGEFVDSELGMIPKGWEIGRIDEFGKVVCGKTPSKKDTANYSSHNGYPFIKIPDMHGKVFVMEGSEMISNKGNKTQLNKLLPTGCINVSCIATVGLVTINVFPSHTNQQINSIIPKKESLKYYIYLSMLNMKERFMNEASGGSATLNMNTSTFSGIELLNPPADFIIQFHSLVKSWYDKILQNQTQNQTLTTLRDTLLPKLISGEVRVKNIKQTIAQVL